MARCELTARDRVVLVDTPSAIAPALLHAAAFIRQGLAAVARPNLLSREKINQEERESIKRERSIRREDQSDEISIKKEAQSGEKINQTPEGLVHAS